MTDSYDRIFPAEDNNDKDVEDNCMLLLNIFVCVDRYTCVCIHKHRKGGPMPPYNLLLMY